MDSYLVYFAVDELDNAARNISALLEEIPDQFILTEEHWLIHTDRNTAMNLAFAPGQGQVIITKLSKGDFVMTGFEADESWAWLKRHDLV